MTREKVMNFMRSDEMAETLTADDRREIFSYILCGSSDITKELLNQLLNDYEVTNLEVDYVSEDGFGI